MIFKSLNYPSSLDILHKTPRSCSSTSSICLVPTALSLLALFSGIWCFSISRLGIYGHNSPAEDWGDTSSFQWFSNSGPLIIICLEMARAYTRKSIYLQLTVISIEFSLFTYAYVDHHNNVFIYMLFVFVEYYVLPWKMDLDLFR